MEEGPHRSSFRRPDLALALLFQVTKSILGQPDFSPWQAVVRPQALARAQQILQKALTAARRSVLAAVADLVAEIHSSPR